MEFLRPTGAGFGQKETVRSDSLRLVEGALFLEHQHLIIQISVAFPALINIL